MTSIKAFVAGECLRKYQQSLGKVLSLNILVLFPGSTRTFFYCTRSNFTVLTFFSFFPGLVGKFTRESRNWVTLMVTSIFSILLGEKTVRKTRIKSTYKLTLAI